MFENKAINRDFIIRIYWTTTGESTLATGQTLRAYVGNYHAEQFIRKAYKSKKQKNVFKLRRGIRIEFIDK